MPASTHRPSQIIISKNAIAHNVREEKKRLASDCELFAVVKANAYGHGAVEVAQIARENGATGFCVSTIDEGIFLRNNKITEPILILTVVSPELVDLLVQYDLQVAVATHEWLTKASIVASEKQIATPIQVHIKVDTGMGRIGFLSSDEVLRAVELINQHKNIFQFQGIFTHFATADEVDATYFEQQSEIFDKVLKALPQMPKYVHVANTATSFWHTKHSGNMIRFGIGLYGLNPSGTAQDEVYPLQATLSLVSELIQVKKVPKGTSIGYGSTYTSEQEEWIGTVPLGYADGWLRKMQDFHVLIRGKKCRIIGRVCMDQFMVQMPEEFSVGDKVTLIGKDGEESISMQEVADYQGTIHYEVACTLGERLPRIYVNE